MKYTYAKLLKQLQKMDEKQLKNEVVFNHIGGGAIYPVIGIMKNKVDKEDGFHFEFDRIKENAPYLWY